MASSSRSQLQTFVVVSMVGWEDSPACTGARRLMELARDGNLARTAVLVPGRRAGRLLHRELLRDGPAFLEPPTILTPTGLVESFMAPVGDLLPATDIFAELVWREALATLDAESEQLFPGMPRPRDVRESLSRAKALRKVCDDLDSIGLTPAEVGSRPEVLDGRDRWNALDTVRDDVHRRLAEVGRIESTLMRSRMLSAGVIKEGAPDRLLVLAVSDPGPLACATIDVLGDRCELLIDAPESEAHAFDRWGRPLPEAWNERPSVVNPEEIELVDRPIEAAEQVLEDLAGLHRTGGPLVPGRVVVGVCDESINPVLERAGRRAGVPLRVPVGRSSVRGELGSLLAALREHLMNPGIESFAMLLREPVIESLLTAEIAGDDHAESEDMDDLVGLLDRWRSDRIGGGLDDLRAGRSGPSRKIPVGILRKALVALESLLEPLVTAGSHESAADSLRELVRLCFASRTEGDDLREDLLVMSAVLDELLDLPPAHDPDSIPSVLLELLLGRMARHHLTPEADVGAIELLGWLELRHEPSTDLVLVGLNESGELSGRHSDGWLPDSLRAELGLACQASRMARDVHAMHVLRARNRSLRALVLKHDAGGDPLSPSHLVLAERGTELARRVVDIFEGTPRITKPGMLAGTPAPAERKGFPPPQPEGAREITSLSVTAFASWLRSPHEHWLQRMEGLDDQDPSALELDARRFGILAHDVVEILEESSIRTSSEPLKIERALLARLDELVRERHGRRPPPAVIFQRRTLEARLKAFAHVQAELVEAGWEIETVEGSLKEPLDIPGQEPVTIHGRIDRIDRHPDGRIRVLDYKTSEKPVELSKKRKKDGTWTDLQLPLYDHLLRLKRNMPDARIELGYISLPTDPAGVGVEVGLKWTPEMLAEGVDQARAIVKAMRSGDFSSQTPARSTAPWRGRPRPIDRILRTGALDVSASGDDSEEGGES